MDAQSAAMLPYNLKIIPLDDKGILAGPPFVAMFNPDNIAINEGLEWDNNTPPGTSGTDPRFIHISPRSFSIDLVLDGTGVNTNGVKIPVTEQVLIFRAATTTINGGIHRPNYLIVQYGLFICDCVMNSSTVTYTMFDLTGLPIRARINASFTERVPNALGNIISMFSSPDLTHVVEVKEGDLLPYLTYETYNDQSYYLQVAKANKLKNFRKLVAGSSLIFPPIANK